MIKRYYSSYTGKQIDEAVKTIVENQIGLEDLSPELVAEIKSWVATGEGGEGIRELEFDSRNKFPELGNPLALYIATDEERIYYWSSEGKYKPLTSPTPDAIINRIAKNESDIKALQENAAALQTQITSANIAISGNAVKIASNETKILNLENALKDKANLAALNEVKASVENLSGIIGLRKEGETRSVFEILEAQENNFSSLAEKVNLNTSSIAGLNEKLPVIEQNIEDLKAKDLQLEENLAALLGTVNNKVPELESEIKALTNRTLKYEVVPVEGLIVDYRDKEIRLNTQRVTPTHQSVGETGNPNMYYVTFKAYAPEGAVSVIEGNNGQMDTEASELSTDASGRKYTVIWAAIANYSNGVWTKWGDSSTVDKYLGFLYAFNWLDEKGNTIQMDQVRVILTNDSCHTDLVPDIIARRIDEKVKEISQIDLNDYYTKTEVDLLLREEVESAASNLGFVNEADEIVLNGGNA
jgi:hypothetical protein